MTQRLLIVRDGSPREQRQRERETSFNRAFFEAFDVDEIVLAIAEDPTIAGDIVADMNTWILASEFRGQWVAEVWREREIRGVLLKPLNRETDA
jgi:hypothetical protein